MRNVLITAAALLVFAGALMPFAVAEDAKKDKDAEGAEKISLKRFEELRKGKDVVVLDVRTPEEFKRGRVPGARNVDVSDDAFAERVGKLDKDKTYLVYCRTGGRSAAASAKMKALGFGKLYNFAGSMAEWEKAGKPVEKGQPKDE